MASNSASHTLPVVLFDLDGTLIDSLELLINAMKFSFEGHRVSTPDVATWTSYIGRPLPWQFAQFVHEEEIPDLIRRYRSYQHEHYDALTRTFDEIPELIRRLHEAGHRLGVVTSKADALAIRSIEHVGLKEYFDVVIGADSSARHKPDAEPILVALSRLGATPDQGVYVGDSIYDIMSGNAAGVVTIGVTWGATLHSPLLESSPTFVATTISELESILTQLRERAGA
ncbi:MAG: HAD-IA family hydrolase [Gemmatimonadaceae bacterium]